MNQDKVNQFLFSIRELVREIHLRNLHLEILFFKF